MVFRNNSIRKHKFCITGLFKCENNTISDIMTTGKYLLSNLSSFIDFKQNTIYVISKLYTILSYFKAIHNLSYFKAIHNRKLFQSNI